MYLVTRKFTSGLLKGITTTQTTAVSFQVGRIYSPCAGSSEYIVLSCEKIA